MKDSVVRARLLHLLYERRNDGPVPFGRLDQALPPPGGISGRDWLHAVAQLSEYGLIDWSPLEDKSGMGLLSGFAKINQFGIDVLQTRIESPIHISLDESQRITAPSQKQQTMATSTPEQEQLTDAFERVIIAIDQADLSAQQKNQSKSLLQKLLSSKAAVKIFGPGAQSLVAKHFKA
jgi:hypothetical protein